MARRTLLLGGLLWLAGTIAIRLAGHRLLRSDQPLHLVILYLVSFVLMALLVRRICIRLRLPRDAWPRAAALLILPTLLLDPFSCLFLTTLFPNLDAGAAGAFGGFMLICCGGGVTGVLVKA
ncbi:MAG TPA: DUF5367 family protein [Polyangia bacterium]|nr:DUF5367 family protein [Polyangia bacterium]